MAQDWFYIRDGQEKSGPVSASHLKGLAASGELRPTDLVWTTGMTEWKPAGKIKGLFDTPPPVPVPTPATVQQPPPNPNVSPVESIPVVTAAPSHRELPPAVTAAWKRASVLWQQLTPRGKVVAGTGGGCFMLFFFCCGLGSLVSVGSNGGVGLGSAGNFRRSPCRPCG